MYRNQSSPPKERAVGTLGGKHVKLDGKFFKGLGGKGSGGKGGGTIGDALTKFISKNCGSKVGYSSERAGNGDLEIFDKGPEGRGTVGETMGIFRDSKIGKSGGGAGLMLRNNFGRENEGDGSPLPDKMSGEQYYTQVGGSDRREFGEKYPESLKYLNNLTHPKIGGSGRGYSKPDFQEKNVFFGFSKLSQSPDLTNNSHRANLVNASVGASSKDLANRRTLNDIITQASKSGSARHKRSRTDQHPRGTPSGSKQPKKSAGEILENRKPSLSEIIKNTNFGEKINSQAFSGKNKTCSIDMGLVSSSHVFATSKKAEPRAVRNTVDYTAIKSQTGPGVVRDSNFVQVNGNENPVTKAIMNEVNELVKTSRYENILENFKVKCRMKKNQKKTLENPGTCNKKSAQRAGLDVSLGFWPQAENNYGRSTRNSGPSKSTDLTEFIKHSLKDPLKNPKKPAEESTSVLFHNNMIDKNWSKKPKQRGTSHDQLTREKNFNVWIDAQKKHFDQEKRSKSPSKTDDKIIPSTRVRSTHKS